MKMWEEDIMGYNKLVVSVGIIHNKLQSVFGVNKISMQYVSSSGGGGYHQLLWNLAAASDRYKEKSKILISIVP